MPAVRLSRVLPAALVGAAALAAILATGVMSGASASDAPARGSLPVPAGFPSASTTGVPAGPHLQAYHGNLKIKAPGTIIENAVIKGCVVIAGNRITIRNTKIVCTEHRPVLLVTGSADHVVLSNVELDGEGKAVVGLGAKNTLARGLNIHDVGDGAHLGRDVTLEDSYIHDLSQGPGIHHDALQTIAGSNASNVEVIHNTLQDNSAHSNGNSVYHGGTGALSHVMMVHNYMDGGQYTIFIANNAAQHDIVFNYNTFGRHYRYGILRSGVGTAVAFGHNQWIDDEGPATELSSLRHSAPTH